MRRTLVILTAAALAGALPLRAQDACSEYVHGAGRAPAVGSWASYRMTDNKDRTTEMRFAIVGAEERNGTEMHWFEMKMTGQEKNQNMIFQILVPGYPYEPGQMQEMVMKAEGQKAMKMGGMMLGMMRKNVARNPGVSVGEECRKMKLVGTESVTVPAGTFSTRHYRDDKGNEVWVSREVPFGTVKATGKNYQMVLAGKGTDATSSITETPEAMPGT